MIVQTTSGYLEGSQEDDLVVFRGVPYAAPPTGRNRFKAPQPVQTWGGIRSAKRCGGVSPQINRFMIPGEVESEDCLYLNVLTPALDGKKRPVMIWIHGGMFVIGSGSARLYRNYEFVKEQDVVLVTINYRLGPFGFLYFDQLKGFTTDFDDNVAIRDQVAAIEWVIENIAQFGGDPTNLTLWGQSAGATAVLTLLTVASLEGKIRGAIAQSPSYHSTWSPEEATWNTRRFLQKVGISEENLHELKQIPAYKLIRAAKLSCRKGEPLSTRAFVPTYGTSLLPLSFEAFVEQYPQKVPPLIIGFTKEESILFTSKRIGLMPLEQSFYEALIAQLSQQEQERLLAQYEGMNTVKSRGNFISDMVWKVPVLQAGAQIGQHTPIWLYELNWTSRLMRWFGIGAFHGMDLFLQFNLVRNKWASRVVHLLHLNSTHRLGKAMQQYWGNFAYSQNPNSPTLPEWTTYHPLRKKLLLLAHTIVQLTDAYEVKEKHWEGILPRAILERLQHLEELKQARVSVKKERTSSM